MSRNLFLANHLRPTPQPRGTAVALSPDHIPLCAVLAAEPIVARFATDTYASLPLNQEDPHVWLTPPPTKLPPSPRLPRSYNLSATAWSCSVRKGKARPLAAFCCPTPPKRSRSAAWSSASVTASCSTTAPAASCKSS